MWEYDKYYFIINLIVSLLNSAFSILNLYFPKYIIDIITEKRDYNKLIWAVALWACIDIAFILVFSMSKKFLSIRKDFLNNHFIMLIYKKMVDMDLNLLESPHTYNLKEKAIDICNKKIGISFCNRFFSIISELLTILSTLALLLSIKFPIFIVLILIIVFNTVLVVFGNKSSFSFWDKVTDLNNESNYYFQLLCDPQTAKEMRLYSLSTWIFKKYNKVKIKFFSAAKTLYNKVYSIENSKKFLSVLQKIFLYLYLGYEFIFAKLTFGNYTLYFNSLNTFSNSLKNIINHIIQTIEDSVYLSSYIEFIELKNQIAIDKANTKQIKLNSVEHFDIELRDVNFQYKGSPQMVLKGINLKINSGKFYVIVGENGAGKTTLVNLICRLYDPCSGEIFLNDNNIIDYNFKEYRDCFGVVFQDYQYYAFSIAENIALEDYDNGHIDNSKVEKAIELSGLKEKIDSLPNGKNTNLRKIFDAQGIELSGGEAQKLAIAKALYKNAEIFIFDEPSSALDPNAEDELINLFRSISQMGKTVILISHRLSVCKYADEVIYMENGNVELIGTHKNLLNNQKYYNYYNKQAQHYTE